MKPTSLVLLLVLTMCSFQEHKKAPISEVEQLWVDCKLKGEIPLSTFELALNGYNAIDGIKKKDLLTIIDFSKPSTEERFYVIDLKTKEVLYKTLVAHGKNTGENDAKHFSNKSNSLKSSLGFFLTAETYSGKHGYSLRLDGLEKNINDNARSRAIVIHGADYVSHAFAKKHGRLGRSWGCPALPVGLSKKIIDKIAKGSCLFAYANDADYGRNSEFSLAGK